MEKSKCVVTLTFGDQAPSSTDIRQIGNKTDIGFTVDDLGKIANSFLGKYELIELNSLLANYTWIKPNAILILRDGVDYLMGDNFADELFKEQVVLDVDKKMWSHGRVVNKIARYNLSFSDEAQEPDYENKKERIVSYREVPYTEEFRKRLPYYLGPKATNLVAEGNYYYSPDKCGIGYHGDTGRKIIIAVILGDEHPLHFQWYIDGERIGENNKIILNHGDIYIMSEYATGFNWKRRNIATLRHAIGAKKYTD